MVFRMMRFNLKKNKIGHISVAVLITIAVSFLILGTFIYFNIDKIVDMRISNTNGAHNYLVLTNEKDIIKKCKDRLDSDETCNDYEMSNILYLADSEVDTDIGKVNMNFIVEEKNTALGLCEQVIIKENESIEEGCYIPVSLRSYGFGIGDELSFKNNQNEYVVKIKGFFDTSAFGLPNYGGVRIILTQKIYESFKKDYDEQVFCKIRLNDEEESEVFGAKLTKELNEDYPAVVYSTNYEKNKVSAVFMSSIVAIVLIIFAMVLLILSFIVIYFMIKSSIDYDIVDIGMLESLGYTHRQIRGIYLAEYLFLTLISCVIGTTSAFILKDKICDILTNFSGVYWNGIELLTNCIASCVFCIVLVGLIVNLSTRMIIKYPTVDALKNIVKEKNEFALNFSIHKSGNGVNAAIGINNIFSSLRQSVMIVLIFIAVSICTSVSGLIYYNMVVENRAFYDIIGEELAQIVVLNNAPDTDIELLEQDILKIENVRSVSMHDMQKNVFIGDREVKTIVSEDFGKMELLKTYAGRFPSEENEVVIGGTLADKLGKHIGDTMTVSCEDESADYKIVGLIQTIVDSGQVVVLTDSGIKKIDEDYERNSIYIYLNNVSDIDATVEEIKSIAGDNELISVVNYDKYAKNAVQTYVDISKYVVTVIFIVSVCIVMLIIVLLVNDYINKKKKEFGIQKALGYTTLQHILQLGYTFMPSVIVGTVIGAIFAGSFLNKALGYVLYSTGVAKLEFMINKPMLALVGATVLVFAYIALLSKANKMKKISPYQLFVE